MDNTVVGVRCFLCGGEMDSEILTAGGIASLFVKPCLHCTVQTINSMNKLGPIMDRLMKTAGDSAEMSEIADKAAEELTSMWKALSEEEAAVFRKWAREHYEPGTPINPMWHPVVRKECRQMNREKGN